MFKEVKFVCKVFNIKTDYYFLGRKRTERSIHVEDVLQYESNNTLT